MSGPLPGSPAIDFPLPLTVGLSVVTMGLLLAVVLSPSERELRSEREYLDRLRGRAEGAPEVDLLGTPCG